MLDDKRSAIGKSRVSVHRTARNVSDDGTATRISEDHAAPQIRGWDGKDVGHCVSFLVARVCGTVGLMLATDTVVVRDVCIRLAARATLARLIENLGHFSVLSIGTSLAQGSDISHLIIGRNRTPSDVTYTTPICPNCLSS